MKARYDLLLLMSSLAAAGCGNDKPSTGGPIGPPRQSCDYAHVDPRCGNACTGQADCGDSLFCSTDHKCTAECVVGGAGSCGMGDCGLFGRCIPSRGPSVGGDGDGGCPRIDVNLAPVTPNVYLLLDQSGSMTTVDFPITPTQKVSRWDALKIALTNRTTGVLPQLDGKVRFAATLYTGVQATRTTPRDCPKLTQTMPLKNGATEVENLLTSNNPLNDTPTAESLDKVVMRLQSTQIFAGQLPGDPTVIVLATDGDPDTCDMPDSNGTQAPRDLSVVAAQKAYAAGYPIFMLSVSKDPNEMHMQDMANAGAGQPAGSKAPYYRANSTQELIDAFNTIIGGVRSCKVRLTGTLDDSGAATGDVRLNGAALQYPNDWKLDDPMTIELLGEACRIYKNSQSGSLTANFACGTIIL